MVNSYIRARRPDGSECEIDLIRLEDALEGVEPGKHYFLPESGKIVFHSEFFDEDEDLEDEDDAEAGGEMLPLDAISSSERFRWMEDFIFTVRSISAQSALRRALNQKKPFRQFKDALLQYPTVRQQWFEFEASKVRAEAISLIKSFDWEVLEVVDSRPVQKTADEIDPVEDLQPTEEEMDWILRGASEITGRGGRTQLALLLKGSKDKKLLKHNLERSAAYGKLSLLTIEEIENRIDHVIRKGDLNVELSGDLPLVFLPNSTWERVRDWSNEQECRRAAMADKHDLNDILVQWRQRQREEQIRLIDSVVRLDDASARRILEAWREVAGKEVRNRIDVALTGRSHSSST